MPQTAEVICRMATVMTLGVCEGYSLTASFLFYTDKRVAWSLCHSRASSYILQMAIDHHVEFLKA